MRLLPLFILCRPKWQICPSLSSVSSNEIPTLILIPYTRSNVNIRTSDWSTRTLKPYGHNLTHAHNHFTPAVTAMDSCFALIGAHQKPEKGAPFGRSFPVLGGVCSDRRSITCTRDAGAVPVRAGDVITLALIHAWPHSLRNSPVSEITLRHCYPGYQRFNFSRSAGIFGVGRRPRKGSGTQGTALPEILKSKVEDRNLIYTIQPTQKFNRDLYKLLTHNFRWVFIVLPNPRRLVY